jgi:hypothetical protein
LYSSFSARAPGPPTISNTTGSSGGGGGVSSKDDLLASIRNAGIGILKPAAERASTSTAHTSAGSYGAGYEDSGTGAGEEEDTAAALKRALAERMKRMGDSDSEEENEDGEWED